MRRPLNKHEGGHKEVTPLNFFTEMVQEEIYDPN